LLIVDNASGVGGPGLPALDLRLYPVVTAVAREVELLA
jgi:hypothetical protein